MKLYQVSYRCGNCFYSCYVKIQFGHEAPVYYTCPECGINTLEKTSKSIDAYADEVYFDNNNVQLNREEPKEQ